MSWIRFDGDRCKESAWFLSLDEAQRWAFLSFVHYSAAKPRGFVKKMSLEILARRIESKLETTKSMLKSAMSWTDPETGKDDPKIIDRGDRWEVVDYPKFNPPKEDQTHAERQRRYKERRTKDHHKVTPVTPGDAQVTFSPSTTDFAHDGKTGELDDNTPRLDKQKQEDSHEVTPGDAGDARRRPTNTNTSTSITSLGVPKEESCKQDAAPPADFKNWEEVYLKVENDFKSLSDDFPAIRPLRGLSDERKRFLRAKFKLSEFDWPELVKIIRGSPFLRGESKPAKAGQRPFVVTFDHLFRRADFWRNVLEGKYSDSTVQGGKNVIGV